MIVELTAGLALAQKIAIKLTCTRIYSLRSLKFEYPLSKDWDPSQANLNLTGTDNQFNLVQLNNMREFKSRRFKAFFAVFSL